MPSFSGKKLLKAPQPYQLIPLSWPLLPLFPALKPLLYLFLLRSLVTFNILEIKYYQMYFWHLSFLQFLPPVRLYEGPGCLNWQVGSRGRGPMREDKGNWQPAPPMELLVCSLFTRGGRHSLHQVQLWFLLWVRLHSFLPILDSVATIQSQRGWIMHSDWNWELLFFLFITFYA